MVAPNRTRQLTDTTQRGVVRHERNDKTRMMMVVAVVLWISTAAMLYLAVRMRMRPMFMVAVLDGLLALFVTMLATHSLRRRRGPPSP